MPKPIVINGDVWRVVRVPAGDPSLIDRTGTRRLATTDPRTKTISVSQDVQPPLLDRVTLHEVAHAVTFSWGLLPRMRREVLRGDIIGAEEWAAQLVENHSVEALRLASEALGRPVCVRGECFD
jgi:hypothetical protein